MSRKTSKRAGTDTNTSKSSFAPYYDPTLYESCGGKLRHIIAKLDKVNIKYNKHTYRSNISRFADAIELLRKMFIASQFHHYDEYGDIFSDNAAFINKCYDADFYLDDRVNITTVVKNIEKKLESNERDRIYNDITFALDNNFDKFACNDHWDMNMVAVYAYPIWVKLMDDFDIIACNLEYEYADLELIRDKIDERLGQNDDDDNDDDNENDDDDDDDADDNNDDNNNDEENNSENDEDNEKNDSENDEENDEENDGENDKKNDSENDGEHDEENDSENDEENDSKNNEKNDSENDGEHDEENDSENDGEHDEENDSENDKKNNSENDGGNDENVDDDENNDDKNNNENDEKNDRENDGNDDDVENNDDINNSENDGENNDENNKADNCNAAIYFHNYNDIQKINNMRTIYTDKSFMTYIHYASCNPSREVEDLLRKMILNADPCEDLFGDHSDYPDDIIYRIARDATAEEFTEFRNTITSNLHASMVQFKTICHDVKQYRNWDMTAIYAYPKWLHSVYEIAANITHGDMREKIIAEHTAEYQKFDDLYNESCAIMNNIASSMNHT